MNEKKEIKRFILAITPAYLVVKPFQKDRWFVNAVCKKKKIDNL